MLACLILEPVPLIKTHTLRFIQWIWKGGSPINRCGFSQHKDSKCFIQMGIHSKKRRSTISWIWEYFVHTKQWARMWQHFRRSSMQPITFFSSSDPGKAICSDRIISDWGFLFPLIVFLLCSNFFLQHSDTLNLSPMYLEKESLPGLINAIYILILKVHIASSLLLTVYTDSQQHSWSVSSGGSD